MKYIRGIFFFILIVSKSVSASNLLDEVLESTEENYPKVINSLQDIEASKQQVLASEGAFDFKVKGKLDQRTEGYYDGQGFDTSIEKPLGYLNSSVYGGWRRSNGDFPSYEGKQDTLDQGE